MFASFGEVEVDRCPIIEPAPNRSLMITKKSSFFLLLLFSVEGRQLINHSEMICLMMCRKFSF